MDETNQNNTNQSQNQAPTWADFKPPVSTTPFGTGQPVDNQATPAVPPATESVLNPAPETPTFPPQSSATAYPWMANAANPQPSQPEPQPTEPAQVAATPPPAEVPVAAPPVEAAAIPTPPTEVAVPAFVAPSQPVPAPVPSFGPPPQSSFTPPAGVPEPIAATSLGVTAPAEVSPPVSVDPIPAVRTPVVAAPSPSSFYPTPMQPPSFNTPAPQIESAPLSEPMSRSTYSPVAPAIPTAAPGVVMPPAGLEPARTSPASIPPISFVQATPQPTPAEPSDLGASSEYLSPQPDPAPEPPPAPPPAPPTPNKKNSALPIIAGAVVLAGLVVAAGYYVFTTRFASHSSATLGAQTISENKDILANSQGPDSWVNDYSTSLLSVERGGLELLITDPPTSVVTPLAVATKSATATTATASAQTVDVTSLVIRVAKAEVHLNTQSVVADGPSPDATKAASKAVDRWETLRLNDSTDVDLMNLRKQGGVLSSVGITYLAAGHYSETRLYITAATVTLSDGTIIHLTINDQNGVIKIVKGFDLSTTNASKMVVDFNAPVSVTKDSSGYHFTPVLSRFLFNGQQI